MNTNNKEESLIIGIYPHFYYDYICWLDPSNDDKNLDNLFTINNNL